MVGTGFFSRFSGYITPQHPLMEEDGVTLLGDKQMGKAKSAELQLDDADFKPIEPPLEPEMGQPIKCPMPDYSLLQKDGVAWKELFGEASTRDKRDVPRKAGKNSEQASAVAGESRRHRLLKRDSFRSMSFRGPRKHFWQVFKDCRECES